MSRGLCRSSQKATLLWFMCPKCNEIPSFDACEDGRLPDQFWEKTEGHFFAALTMPTSDERVSAPATYLKCRRNFASSHSERQDCRF